MTSPSARHCSTSPTPRRRRASPTSTSTSTEARARDANTQRSRVFRSRVLGFACAFVLVACAASVGNVSLRLRPTMAKRTARTVKEYGRAGELHLLRWTAAGGFEAVALGPSTDGVKARAEIAMKVIIETIKRYYPHRLEDGQNPFELLYEVQDKPSTYCVDAAATVRDARVGADICVRERAEKRRARVTDDDSRALDSARVLLHCEHRDVQRVHE